MSLSAINCTSLVQTHFVRRRPPMPCPARQGHQEARNDKARELEASIAHEGSKIWPWQINGRPKLWASVTGKGETFVHKKPARQLKVRLCLGKKMRTQKYQAVPGRRQGEKNDHKPSNTFPSGRQITKDNKGCRCQNEKEHQKHPKTHKQPRHGPM